jgi:hypothetical protein
MMTQTITAMKAFRADAFLVAMMVRGAPSLISFVKLQTMVVKHSGASAANDGLPAGILRIDQRRSASAVSAGFLLKAMFALGARV